MQPPKQAAQRGTQTYRCENERSRQRNRDPGDDYETDRNHGARIRSRDRHVAKREALRP